MLDPITALGVAGNVVQLIEFCLKATSKTREIHHSADRALAENIDLEVVTTDLAIVVQKLVTHGGARTGSDGLDDLCGRCTEVATELLAALEGFKVAGQKSKLKSVRKALKTVWGKRRVEEMKTRLEGFRNEMQLRVVVNLKFDIDIESTRQSERFDTLAAHAKAIFEAISTQQESTKEAMQIESAESSDRHTKTRTTIIAKQEEVHLNISKKIEEALFANEESVHTLISSEASRSDERHRDTSQTIVAKQDETHTEVIETLQSLDATARADQEATRRELEQLKRALEQIEQDMRQRDEELKELLKALSYSHNKKERKALRERSNAVTVALVALMTIYETLQQMLGALHSHTKHLMTTASIKIWGVKYTHLADITDECSIGSILDAILCKPTWITEELAVGWAEDDQVRYSKFLESLLAPTSSLNRTRNIEFRGIKSIHFDKILSGQAPLLDRERLTIQAICRLAILLDCRLHSSGFSLPAIETLKSLIILTTFLMEIHSIYKVSQVLRSVFGTHAKKKFKRPFPRDIYVWSKIGEIAGFRTAAAEAIDSRLRKWGVPSLFADHANFDVHVGRTEQILEFITGDDNKHEITFSIGSTAKEHSPYVTWSDVTSWSSISDTIRALPARHYALIEYLNEFGFPLCLPVIEVDPRGLVARIEKKGRDSAA